jgi:hypothetical protein
VKTARSEETQHFDRPSALRATIRRAALVIETVAMEKEKDTRISQGAPDQIQRPATCSQYSRRCSYTWYPPALVIAQRGEVRSQHSRQRQR